MEVLECVECHGSIPHGRGTRVAGKDLCPECVAKLPRAEVLGDCTASREAYPEIPAAPPRRFAADGMPLDMVNPPHEGSLWMIILLVAVGVVQLIAAVAEAKTSGIIAGALALGSLFWFTGAVVLSLLRDILGCLERAAPGPKAPKT